MRKLTHPADRIVRRLQRQAQERAQELARQVPWQILLETRNQYLEWQEFYYWARSIIECEERLPDWLERRLQEMCPGFIGSEAHLRSKQGAGLSLALSLEKWIDEHIFGFAARAGWLPAVTFYAVREPRCGKVSRHWSESVKSWRKVRPREYPSFDEWRRAAQSCDETIDLLPKIRKQHECFKLVQSERLADAVSRYIDWEAFANWTRPALDQGPPLLREVASAIDERCPGFLDWNATAINGRGQLASEWDRLLLWIVDHFFQDAKTEGWFDAILVSVRMHPRSIRTIEYADHCEEVWKGELPVPYPSFEVWRQDADRYVEGT